jgi:hypothetical protein
VTEDGVCEDFFIVETSDQDLSGVSTGRETEKQSRKVEALAIPPSIS